MDVSAEATAAHSGSGFEGRRQKWSREAEMTEKHPLRAEVVVVVERGSAVPVKNTLKRYV